MNINSETIYALVHVKESLIVDTFKNLRTRVVELYYLGRKKKKFSLNFQKLCVNGIFTVDIL